jgi:hypothetical protein
MVVRESKRAGLTGLRLKTMTPFRRKRLPRKFWKANSTVSKNNSGLRCESSARVLGGTLQDTIWSKISSACDSA